MKTMKAIKPGLIRLRALVDSLGDLSGITQASPLVTHLTAFGLGVALALVLFRQTPQFGLGLKSRQSLVALDPEWFGHLPDKLPQEGYLIARHQGSPVCRVHDNALSILRMKPAVLLKGDWTMAASIEKALSKKGSIARQKPEFAIASGREAPVIPQCMKQVRVSYGTDG